MVLIKQDLYSIQTRYTVIDANAGNARIGWYELLAFISVHAHV